MNTRNRSEGSMKSAGLKALLDYQQADMEGVMVLVSRQAVHEVADEVKRLQAIIFGPDHKPCDCEEEIGGKVFPRCDCGNSGDTADMSAWCSRENMRRAASDKRADDLANGRLCGQGEPGCDCRERSDKSEAKEATDESV